MSRLTKVSIDSVLYDIGSKGINSYATLSEMVNEKVSELYDGCIAWCNEDKKYYQWLSENEIISQFGRWRELEFGSEFQVSDPTVDASTEKYKGKIIQYVGVDDVASGFKRGCFYESRLSNVINYVVATVDASTVGTYYTLDDEGNYNPITLIGDGTGYDASTVYYKKQDVEVYSWAYINSLKVETEFDETSENAIANGIITKKFDEVIQDYTDKNEELKEYVDTDVTTALQQYADEKIDDEGEVSENKTWSNSKINTKFEEVTQSITDSNEAMTEYIDTTLEDYTKSATEILQAEYDALDEETKLANNYHCTDTGRMYYKGILYGDKKPIDLTYEEYKTLEEAGLVEADVDYVVHSNESGVSLPFLLSDIDTNHGDSEISTYEVIEELKSDVLTVKDEIANPIKTTLDIALAENDCDNIPSLMEDLTTVVCTVSGDTVAHTPKDTFSAESGFFEITTTRQNSTYAWQTAKKLAEKSNTFQRCLLNGVWSDWTSTGSIRNEVTNDVNTWSSSKIASSIIGTKTQYRGSQSIDISTSSKLTFIYSSMYASQAGCYMLLSNYNTTPLLIELGKFPQSSFNVTSTNKSFGVDTITVTTASDEYSWYVLQF